MSRHFCSARGSPLWGVLQPLTYGAHFAGPTAVGLLARQSLPLATRAVPSVFAAQGPGTWWQFSCTCLLRPSPGASEGVLSQCDRGGAVKQSVIPAAQGFRGSGPGMGFPGMSLSRWRKSALDTPDWRGSLAPQAGLMSTVRAAQRALHKQRVPHCEAVTCLYYWLW